jgi:hypothetical protein
LRNVKSAVGSAVGSLNGECVEQAQRRRLNPNSAKRNPHADLESVGALSKRSEKVSFQFRPNVNPQSDLRTASALSKRSEKVYIPNQPNVQPHADLETASALSKRREKD